MEDFLEAPRIIKSRQILFKRRYWIRAGGSKREREEMIILQLMRKEISEGFSRKRKVIKHQSRSRKKLDIWSRIKERGAKHMQIVFSE